MYKWKDAEEIERYSKKIQALSFGGRLLMWPPPKQLERAGRKDPDSISLQWIADQSNSLHPTTELLVDIPNAIIRQGTVLKRSHSDCSHHVILPQERRKRTTDNLKGLSPVGECWLQQEYIATLKDVGEWRTFLVNGTVVHTVHTYRLSSAEAWQGRHVTSFWSLDELRWVNSRERLSAPPGTESITPYAFSEADRGNHAARLKAKEEFESFAVTTWKSLVNVEKGVVVGTPCTAIFCRLDIGVMMRDAKISYFVNEIERSLTTSLWMSAMPTGLHGVLADTFGEVLHQWISGAREPCHV
ncbi:hypothetical protein JVT61DRAFT_6126 [Boletus reticuloceps]|uniref:ATP-grasp fold RimK-type domain-containing protein n=1 Tax=Boletus reticuloceps TaxID=495285 RepID=A0A8I2YL75_9AGAM|nr:hypothetical protein JVT61DRAFT_6126 [Boletus reticuloceps]